MITYDDVNKGISEVMEYLDSIDNIWNKMRDLKLHDVSYESDDIIKSYPLVSETYTRDDLFCWFCESSYESFEEWMTEDNIKDQRVYIRRTSRFYLTNIHDNCKMYILANLMNAASSENNYCDFDKDCKMVKLGWGSYTEEELLELAQDEMEYYANGEFLKDVKKFFEDAIKEAEYIDSFKENQIEYFKEYLQNLEDMLEYDKEQQEKRKYEIALATMACYI